MTLFPVIARELRSTARQPFTYYLRTIGVGALLAASLLFGLEHGFGPTLGGRLFSSLHLTLFIAIWILVPLLTADCISRERREGTLGLLFLTHLRGTDIVIAKSIAHGLRAFTLWVSVLPVLTLPFLLGGVSWSDALVSILINFDALCWALAAGLLASAWSTAWMRALIVAAILALIFFLTLWFSLAFFFLRGVGLTPMLSIRVGRLDYALLNALALLTQAQAHGTAPMGPMRFSFPPSLLFGLLGQPAALAVLALAGAIILAGAKTRHSWQQEPPSRRQLWFEQTFTTPILWLDFFRGWMRRKLERNPIGWLEQRTWSGRLITWTWFAIIISIYSAVLTDRNFFRDARDFQMFMAWVIAGSLAFSAAGSFQRERATGVLELLLVSPLGEGEIIWGRLRGLWAQFLPACGTLLLLWTYFSTLFREPDSTRAIWYFFFTFLTLPVIGLYFSLRCRNFITAFLATMAAGLLMPLVLPGVCAWIWSFYIGSGIYLPPLASASGGGALMLLLLAAILWTRLYQRLRKRGFPLERNET